MVLFKTHRVVLELQNYMDIVLSGKQTHLNGQSVKNLNHLCFHPSQIESCHSTLISTVLRHECSLQSGDEQGEMVRQPTSAIYW